MFKCFCYSVLLLLLLSNEILSGKNDNKMVDVLKWKQLSYVINGVHYRNSSDVELKEGAIIFDQELEDQEKFFIQPNNVPIGFEVYGDRIFITVPRRRHGTPSTLNYVHLTTTTPYLKPYPGYERSKELVSVYRPRVDACGRLWMVDTGHFEVPGERKQLQPPAIIVYDLKTDKQIYRHNLDPSILVTERTSAGLTSITVDVSIKACDDAFAYINDLATEGLVVFSMRENKSWRVDHPSFKHDEGATNFTSSGQVINWRDGLFSIALRHEKNGRTKAYYHPFVSKQEFAVDTAVLKTRSSLDALEPLVGFRGNNSQSGSHDYHLGTNTMFYANVAQSAILCWNLGKELTPSNVQIVAKDDNRLGYISDLKVKGDEVWVLANQIPKFIYNTQNINEYNYFVMKGNVHKLIKGTVCDAQK